MIWLPPDRRLVVPSRNRQRGFLLNPYRFGERDPFYNNVSLLLHGDGANGGTVFTDNSPSPKTPTRFGNVVTSTAQQKFGSASLLYDGSGDALLYAHTADLHLDRDFTVEFWMRPASTADSHIINKGGGINVAFASYEVIYVGGQLRFAASSSNAGYEIGSESGSASLIGTPAIDSWSHVAVSRSGNSYRGFLAGALAFTITSSLSPYNSTPRGLTVGALWKDSFGTGTPVGSFNGYLDDLRITNGAARYTAAFTPPTAAFPNS